jgi:hypothetical protein
MRTFLAVAVLVSLAACDDGGAIDQTIARGVRESAVQTCMAWVPQSDIAAAAGLDGDRLCACATDRVLSGKSVAELGELRPDSAEGRAALVECVAEIQSNSAETSR